MRTEANGHETSPPPRYTEATLVKAMEERGIGRPSTYASTIGTIQDRGYVSNRGSALIPSWLAFAVTRLMEEHFSRLVDYDFTASMEEDLDAIARGDQERAAWLHRFYFGDEATSPTGCATSWRTSATSTPGDLDDRHRRGHRRAGRPVRAVRRGGRAPGRRPDDRRGDEMPPRWVTPTPASPRRATINDDVAPDELDAGDGP